MFPTLKIHEQIDLENSIYFVSWNLNRHRSPYSVNFVFGRSVTVTVSSESFSVLQRQSKVIVMSSLRCTAACTRSIWR